MGRYLSILQGSEATELDATRLKIASSALNGDLEGHPLIQGLVLQTRRLMDKRMRGIETMAGRRSRETDKETQLILDAGVSLAFHAGNSALAKEVGLSPAALRVSLDVLAERCLPMPALAVNSEETMLQNFLLCDQRFPVKEGSPRCFWDMHCKHSAFDVCRSQPFHVCPDYP